MKNILVLYSEVMGYNLACFRELASRGYAVHCIQWDVQKKTPYVPENELNIFFYKRSVYDASNIMSLAHKVQPELILVSGWMDKEYLKVCKILKKQLPVVSGIDNWWTGSLKQHLASVLSFYLIKPYFSHLFVPGAPQYTFAKKLGYPDHKILKGLYTCDNEIFTRHTVASIESKKTSFPKTIVFVGRYNPIKGIIPFVTAFKEVAHNLPGWKLMLYGNGALKETLSALQDDQILVHDFVKPELLADIFSNAGIFCLPSIHEPWGQVVHEATCSGLPLLVSKNIGACSVFLDEGNNGLSFDINDKDDIKRAILTMCSSPVEKFLSFSKRSLELSKLRSTQKWADELLSVVK